MLNKAKILSDPTHCFKSAFPVNTSISDLNVLPNGYLAIINDILQTIDIRDPDNGSLIFSVNSTDNFSFFVLPDGTLTSSNDEEIDFYNTTDGELLNAIYTGSYSIISFAFIENGYLAGGGFFGDTSIEIWNINNNTLVNKIDTGYPFGVTSLTYIDSGLLASSDFNYITIQIWNVTSGLLERTLRGHTDHVDCLLTLKNGSLISGSEDKTIKIWDAHTGDLLNTWTDTDSVGFFAEFPDMGLLASTGVDGIKIWNSSTGKILATFQDSSVFYIVALPNGSLASLTFRSDSNFVKIWNVKDCF